MTRTETEYIYRERLTDEFENNREDLRGAVCLDCKHDTSVRTVVENDFLCPSCGSDNVMFEYSECIPYEKREYELGGILMASIDVGNFAPAFIKIQ